MPTNIPAWSSSRPPARCEQDNGCRGPHQRETMEANCQKCEGTGWVCENHPDLSFDHSDNSCKCGGAGMPCVCNPAGKIPEDQVVLVSIRLRNEGTSMIERNRNCWHHDVCSLDHPCLGCFEYQDAKDSSNAGHSYPFEDNEWILRELRYLKDSD
jgi:hypothetical protein